MAVSRCAQWIETYPHRLHAVIAVTAAKDASTKSTDLKDVNIYAFNHFLFNHTSSHVLWCNLTCF